MTRDTKLALGAAAVVAAIEFPVSQYYATVPPTKTPMRMAIAASMAFVGVMVASKLIRSDDTPRLT
jgi:hypothetical protein